MPEREQARWKATSAPSLEKSPRNLVNVPSVGTVPEGEKSIREQLLVVLEKNAKIMIVFSFRVVPGSFNFDRIRALLCEVPWPLTVVTHSPGLSVAALWISCAIALSMPPSLGLGAPLPYPPPWSV